LAGFGGSGSAVELCKKQNLQKWIL
jgi:hypothetical protein